MSVEEGVGLFLIEVALSIMAARLPAATLLEPLPTASLQQSSPPPPPQSKLLSSAVNWGSTEQQETDRGGLSVGTEGCCLALQLPTGSGRGLTVNQVAKRCGPPWDSAAGLWVWEHSGCTGH